MRFCHRLMMGLLIAAISGCAAEQMRFSSIRHAARMPEIYQGQVMENLARTADNFGSMPFFSRLYSGTLSVTDRGIGSVSIASAPRRFTSVTNGLNGERDIQANIGLDPVNDPMRLAAMQCAYQVVAAPGMVNPTSLISLAPYLRGQDPSQGIPRGWLHVGCKHDVPKDVCYVACHGHTYVWVLAVDLEALTRFTLFILDIATLKTDSPPDPAAVASGASRPAATPSRVESPGFNPNLLLVPRP